MKSKHILVTGSLAFDLIMDFPGVFADNIDATKIHLINLSFLVKSLTKEKGGTAGNIAYSLALLKTPVGILATVGDDFAEYENKLQSVGVDTKWVKVIKNESTSQAFIVTDKHDNQIAAFYPGAMTKATFLDISNLETKPDFVVISPTDPEAMVNFTGQCQKENIPYLFDPGMALPRLSDIQIMGGISQAEILIGNDYEMGLIKKRLQLTNSELLHHVKVIITTMGEKGSIIQTNKVVLKIAAVKPDQVVDPTGAGDAYRSGFLAGYLRDLDLKICGQMGSVAASFAVEKYGTINHQYTFAIFSKRFQDNFGKELNLYEKI